MSTLTTYYSLPKPGVNDPADADQWGTLLNQALDLIDSALHTIASSSSPTNPTGAIIPFASDVVPSGYLLCYGQAINRTTYAALFAVIGTVFGAGDGSTTFNIPDLRGRAIAGQDDMGGSSANRLTGLTGGVDGDVLGATGGLESHVLTIGQLPAHTHTGTTDTVADHTHNITAFNRVNNVVTGGGTFAAAAITGGNPNTAATDAAGSHNHTITMNNTGSGDAHNNVQPTIIMNYIIKT